MWFSFFRRLPKFLVFNTNFATHSSAGAVKDVEPLELKITRPRGYFERFPSLPLSPQAWAAASSERSLRKVYGPAPGSPRQPGSPQDRRCSAYAIDVTAGSGRKDPLYFSSQIKTLASDIYINTISKI